MVDMRIPKYFPSSVTHQNVIYKKLCDKDVSDKDVGSKGTSLIN